MGWWDIMAVQYDGQCGKNEPVWEGTVREWWYEEIVKRCKMIALILLWCFAKFYGHLQCHPHLVRLSHVANNGLRSKVSLCVCCSKKRERRISGSLSKYSSWKNKWNLRKSALCSVSFSLPPCDIAHVSCALVWSSSIITPQLWERDICITNYISHLKCPTCLHVFHRATMWSHWWCGQWASACEVLICLYLADKYGSWMQLSHWWSIIDGKRCRYDQLHFLPSSGNWAVA